MARGGQREAERHDTSDTKPLQRQRSGLQDDPHQKATIAYIKRTLCAKPRKQVADGTESLEDLLPPLTSSNPIDIELYALISVILSNFVQVWYSRITPDQDFVAEIVQIIAHCTRGLEQRLRQVDLEALLLDELPDLLLEHIQAVRVSRTSRTGEISTYDRRTRYLALHPHTALEPVPRDVAAFQDQQENEVAWCLLLVNRVLPLILPPEDLLNPCLDVLVSEIFSEMIFHNGICGKACEPWLLWDGITKALQAIRPEGRIPLKPQQSAKISLGESGLLSAASASNAAERHVSLRGRLDAAIQLFWLTIQCVMTLWFLLRAVITTLVQARSFPSRASRFPLRSQMAEKPEHVTRILSPELGTRPIISMNVWGLVSQLLLLDQRMPWLTGILSLLQWAALYGPGQLCRTNSTLDRLASSHVQNLLLSGTWLPVALRAARSAMFPENALAPPRIPPTETEVLRIKRDCALAMVDAVPEAVRSRFFANGHVETMADDVEDSLELLGDAYINKHLIIAAVDLIAVRLFPELIDGGAGDVG